MPHEAGEEAAQRVENTQTDGGDEEGHPETLYRREMPAIGARESEPQRVQHDVVGHVDEESRRAE